MSVGLAQRETIPFPDFQRPARDRVACAAAAWAYLHTLAGGSAVSSTFLALFQRTYNDRREAILSTFSDRETADRVLPLGLAVDGVYGPNTRTAMAASLAAGIIGTGVSWDASWDVMQTIPTNAGGLPNWFRLTLSPYVHERVGAFAPIALFLDAVADFAWMQNPTTAAADLDQMLNVYVQGGASEVGAAPGGVGPTGLFDTIADTFRPLTEEIAAASGATLPGATAPVVTALPPLFTQASAAPALVKPWVWWAVGAGALTLTGFLGFQAWKKAKRRRRK